MRMSGGALGERVAPVLISRIAALEGALRLKLVERCPRAYFLTPDGARIAELGRRMELESLAVQRTALAGQSSIAGEVAATLIAPRLPELRGKYPDLHIRLDAGTRNVSLVRREADIAIRLSRPVDEELVVRKIDKVIFSLCAGRTYLAVHDADNRACIAYDTSMDDTPQQLWLLAQVGNAPIVLRSNDLAVLAAGVGGIAVHSDLRHAPRIQAVTAFLAGCFEHQ